MKKALILGAFVMFLSVVVYAVIPAGYITFVVTDQDGNPIADVELVIHSDKTTTFEEILTTDKKGKVKILLKLADYTVQAKKDGFQPVEQAFRPTMSQRKDVEITMYSLAAVSTPSDPSQLKGKDKAIAIFNNAVPLLKAGNDAEALPLLEEAIAADDSVVQAKFHAGRIHLIQNNLDKSEKYLLEALEQDSTMDSIYPMLAELYKRKGDTANYEKYLAEAESRGAVSAVEYYNQAAELINAGNDTEALVLLEKAISVDANYADAYYQYGMAMLRTGDIPKCLENLNKYLELDPEGSHAQECRDFIKALGSM